MSSSAVAPLRAPSTESTRRRLSAKQAATVQRLTAATVEELRRGGYEGLTVRNVARTAGVAPATAYTYFASREHLVTEVFWRRLEAQADTTLARRRSTRSRVAATMADLALLVADEPELAAACTVAMLSHDPDVRLLRDRIGLEIHRRLGLALGELADADMLTTLEFAVSGALLQAGMGHLSYDALPEQLERVVTMVVPAG